MNTKQSQNQLAWKILQEADEAFDAIRMAQDAAKAVGATQPQSIPEYLVWIEREAIAQVELLESHSPDGYRTYAAALKELSRELRDLGFSSAVLEAETQA